MLPVWVPLDPLFIITRFYHNCPKRRSNLQEERYLYNANNFLFFFLWVKKDPSKMTEQRLMRDCFVCFN